MSKRSRNRNKSKLNSQGAIFGQPGGYGGQQSQGGGGGWGLGEAGGKQAIGQNPAVNPWLMPKQAGVNIFSNTFTSNYYVEWNTSTWRAVCDQAYNQGNMVGLATLYTWCFEKSPFIQSLFRKRGNALNNIPFYMSDKKGKPLDEWTEELCNKPWQKKLRKEICFADMWGSTGLNFDPFQEKLYKYPLQQIDPINRLLRAATYDYSNGLYFDDCPNLLFVQPSTNVESFLGMMQAICHDFIQMNVTDNNWIQSGTRLAFPIFGVGYPQNDTTLDPITQQAINPYKIDAERIAADIDPSKGIAFPYTINEKGEIQKSLMLEFEKPGTSANQHLTFKDFGEKKKIEIQELVFGRSLSNASGKGNRALGEVEQETVNENAKVDATEVMEVLNADVLPKLKRFYKNMPDDIMFNIDGSTTLTIPEIVQLSAVLVSNGKRLTDKFFEDQGINKEYFEDGPITEEEKPVTEPVVQMAGLKKKNLIDPIIIGAEYLNLHHHHHKELSFFADKKPVEKLIPPGLTEEEKKYIYVNNKGKVIFTPMYDRYKELFTGTIVDHTNIKADFEAFKDTGIYERYMLNAVQFSAAKSTAEAGLMQSAVFDEDKAVKSFSQFSKDANAITNVVNGTWLRTEYDTGIKQAASAELFNRMREDADLYPYWVYEETISANPREDHLAMVGLVFRIGDPDGDACHPQNGFNCECGSSTLDDQALSERGLRVLSNEEAGNYLKTDVDPQFRFNSADQGIMPKDGHSYFQALPNANKADYKLFDLPAAKDMPDTIDRDINNRIAKIKEQAPGLVDENEIRQTKEHNEEIAAIFKGNESLYKEFMNCRLNGEFDAYKEKVKVYNEGVARISELKGKIAGYKSNYAERAAELLKSGSEADITLTGAKSKSITRGANIFKKIVGDKTNIEGLSLKSKTIKGRASYSLSKDIMNVNADEQLSTIAHEMGHWLETKDKQFYGHVQDFYEARTAGGKVVKLRNLFPKHNYGAAEVIKEDKFIHSYTGKLYLNKNIIGTFDKESQYATEITSMWFTHALSDLDNFIKKDPDHFEFIYKLFNR